MSARKQAAAVVVAGVMVGAGTTNLLLKPDNGLPPLPSVVLATNRAPAVYYFAATAFDTNAAESVYSNEVVFTNSGKVSGVTLAWDASPGGAIAGYRVYAGRASRNYTNIVEADTNLWAWVRLVPAALTNRVLTASTAGSNLAWAAAPGGPWRWLNATNWSATNPAANGFFRGAGRSNRVAITIKRQ